MSAGAESLLHSLRRLLARPQVASHVKGCLFLLAVAAVVGLLAVRIRAIKRQAAAETDREAEEWPTGREEHGTRTDRFGDSLPSGALARLGTTRLRPGMMVSHLCFSPDGMRLLSWAESWSTPLPRRLSIWDTATGRQRYGLELPEDYDGQFTWLKDGRALGLLARRDCKHLVWDFSTEGAAGSLPAPQPAQRHTGALGEETDRSYAISPNGELVAVGRGSSVKDAPHGIDVRKLVVGQHVEDLEPVRRLGPHPGSCDRLLFSADSRLLFAVSSPQREQTNTLSVWEVAGGKQVAQWTIPALSPLVGDRKLAPSPDGTTLALGLPEGTARLLDLASGHQKHSLTVTPSKAENPRGASAVAFGPDGKHLVTGGHDGFVRVWETATGRELWARRGNHYGVIALAVSPDGKRIASGGREDLIRIWDTATGADACPFDSHDDALVAVATSPDGQRVVTRGRNNVVCVWEAATGRLLHRHDPGRHNWLWLTFTPDGQNLLGVHGDRLELWDAATGAAVRLPGRLGDYRCTQVSLSGDGKTLALLSGREALIWDWPTGRLRRRFDVRPDAPASAHMYCKSLSLSTDGHRLLVVTDFGQGPQGAPASAADVWDVASGKHLRRLGTRTGYLATGIFIANGDSGLLLADTVSPEVKGEARWPSGSLVSLDVHTGKVRQVFVPPATGKKDEYQPLYPVTCSADGRVVACAARDASVLLYEAATGLPRRRLRGHRGPVTALSFTPDGKQLITGSTDTSGLVWDVSLTALAEPAELPPEHLWEDLAGSDTKTVNRALASLAASPEAAVALLGERLDPATPEGGEPSAEDVREGRALEVLEHIGTAEAQALLAELAKGAPEAWLTQEARRCLDRLGARRPTP
jgi:WD40 repeat protein